MDYGKTYQVRPDVGRYVIQPLCPPTTELRMDMEDVERELCHEGVRLLGGTQVAIRSSDGAGVGFPVSPLALTCPMFTNPAIGSDRTTPVLEKVVESLERKGWTKG
jgi:hypothetical protein